MQISYAKLADNAELMQHRALFRLVFGKDLTPGLFDWKYRRNPFHTDHSGYMIFVAKDGDRVVGARSLFPTWVFFRGQRYRAAQGGDAMVHPQYRGRGIFTKLVEFSVDWSKKQGCATLFNFPNLNSLPANLKLGAQRRADIYNAVRILDWKAAVRRTKTRLPAPSLPEEDGVSAPGQYKLDIVSHIPAEVDYLFAETFAGQDYVVQQRTADYLNWRFASYPNPYKSYRFMLLKYGKKLVGYAVLAVSGNRVGEICDYLVQEHDEGLFRILLGGALEWYKGLGVSHVKTWYTLPRHKFVLTSRFFVPKRHIVAFVTRFLAPQPFANAPWYITMGDTDTF